MTPSITQKLVLLLLNFSPSILSAQTQYLNLKTYYEFEALQEFKIQPVIQTPCAGCTINILNSPNQALYNPEQNVFFWIPNAESEKYYSITFQYRDSINVLLDEQIVTLIKKIIPTPLALLEAVQCM